MQTNEKTERNKRICAYFDTELANKIENGAKKFGVSQGIFVRIMVIKGLDSEEPGKIGGAS